ncbi:universal stress protein UspA [Salipaludibacillus keqinensis]|uniref:Universal stress protein n=1 Tax=Salipaludibacillus keqinensis TaxID=2045207 RepID=A0A323TG88_9BACI|nr:universal stress protein [Salipaludibacillus keqinensis]PYZ93838.1 universal stress protein UspA [Salipaludibacillus keqinensis]
MLDETYTHVLVAYDGSTDAKKALVKAINIAKRNDAALTVAYVVDLRSPHLFADKPGKITELAEEHAKEMQNEIEEKLKEAKFSNYQLRIEKGNPKTVITYDLIDEVSADIVVCGSNGIDSYDHLVIGSTSENIVRYSTVDVLVVK